jgi:hypothetical protein
MDACDAGGVGLELSMHLGKGATQTLRPLSQVRAGTFGRGDTGHAIAGEASQALLFINALRHGTCLPAFPVEHDQKGRDDEPLPRNVRCTGLGSRPRAMTT